NELISLYAALGEGLKREFAGSRAAVISSSQDLLSCMKLHADKVYKLFNGEIPCQLRVYSLIEDRGADDDERQDKSSDFTNRLAKNLARLRKWAEREGTDAYRIYDADVPEFQAAVDYYAGHVMIQAYLKKDASPKVQRARELDMIAGAIEATGAQGKDVVLKSREIQHGSSQYEKSEQQSGEFFEVHEGAMRFLVNIRDYLDTGLFLDARIIRKILMEKAKGKRFLNLFCYTATASVAASLGGAASTTSVDMSRTYLQWARRNLDLNGCSEEGNRLVQADVLAWICQERGDADGKFDLIYVDPPTFSNSKRMRQSFDVRRDHARLLGNITNLLEDGGTVVFCTNSRGFKPDLEALGQFGYEVTDISAKTLPEDFKRDARIHSCFELSYTAQNRTAEPEPFEAGPAPRWQKEIGADGEEGGQRGGSDRTDRGSRYGERRPRYADRDRSSRYGGRDRGYGDRERSYGDRDRGHGDRGRSYGDRERGYGDRERSHGDRDGRSYGSRSYGGRDERSYGPRSYGGRDERSYGSHDSYGQRNSYESGFAGADAPMEEAAGDGKLHLRRSSERKWGQGDGFRGRDDRRRDDRFGDRRRDDRFGDRRRDDRFGYRRRDDRFGRGDGYGDRERRYGRRDDRRREDGPARPTGRVFGPDGVKDL
ncbi:MAG: bifunctional 23S rRNA (guanine(2069)-N(7))-methyltransferase RlmK/23S rRNA (guanine(2445)-N(2))-methyltransferase RlmL, partial [Succinivibrio sp.]